MRVCIATRMAVNSPIVVRDASSIVWMSFLSVFRAVDKIELDELLDSLEAWDLVALFVVAATVVLDEVFSV